MREDVQCPEYGHEKEVYIDGRESKAGTICSECGNGWEFDMDRFQ
jgi:transcription elongation factor Elf1